MKNLFIVFPGGCGGNHLANLISLNNKFTPLFKSNNYHNDMLICYKNLSKFSVIDYKGEKINSSIVHGVKTHFSDYHHLNQLYEKDGLERIINSTTINILIGHNHCFADAEQAGKLVSKIPDPYWIVMSYPRINSISYNRIKLYNFSPRPEVYTFPFYIKENGIKEEWSYADENNGMFFDTDNFVQLSGCKYIQEKLDLIDIKLHDLAYELHEIWYNKIIEILTAYDMMPTKYFNEYGDLN